MLKLLNKKVQVGLKENVAYQLRDKDGNVKQLFQDNALNRTVLKFIRFEGEVLKYGKKRSWLGNKVHNWLMHKLGVDKMEQLRLEGLRINGVTGLWKDSIKVANLVTTAGKAGAASRLMGSGGEAVFQYIEVGIGTTAANAADTALESAITDSGMARVAGTLSRVTTTVTNDTAQSTTTFSVTGTKAVTESGVLNAASAGVLLCRQTFSAINVVSGDSLTITWKVAHA